MDKHDKQQQKLLEQDDRKQEMHHFTNVHEHGFDEFVIVYVLKAERPNKSQYALGVYSKGEAKEMLEHANRHTYRTGERVWDMETSIQLV